MTADSLSTQANQGFQWGKKTQKMTQPDSQEFGGRANRNKQKISPLIRMTVSKIESKVSGMG